MKPFPLRPLFVGLGLLSLSSLASGQTATWTGNALTTLQGWNDVSRWDTGTVPNSTAAVAVINNPAVATSYPSGGIQILSSTVDLAELRLGSSVVSSPDTWAQRVVVSGPTAFPLVGSTLNLHGAGITAANGNGADPRYVVSVGMGSQVHFYNSATISGPNVSIGFEAPHSGFSATVGFHDQSSAGNASIALVGSGVGAVTFRDRSSAATATIHTDTLTFAGQSTAASAQIFTSAVGSTVMFKDQADAGNASISPTRYGTVIFEDQSRAGNATVVLSMESGVVIRGQADTSGLTIRSRGESVLPVGITGTGALDISGAAGNVTLRGLNGTVRVNLGANTLILGPSAVDQLLYGRFAGSGGLVFDTGRVVTVGLSQVVFPNENIYTGPTEVRSGSLHLDNGRVSATTIAIGARLTGTGKVGGNLVNSGAILPGSSVGAISVEGNFVQNPTGVLAIEINSPTSFDQLTVTGTATLGGTLNLTGTGGLDPVGSATFRFLSAGALNGRFDIVVLAPGLVPGLGAARTAELVYSTTSASYQVTQLPFAGFGKTAHATALGAHLDATLAGSAGEYRSLLAGLNTLPTPAAVGAALEALAPDRYSVLAENALASASARRAATDRRLAAARSSTDFDSSFFFEAGTRRAIFRSTDAVPEARSRLDRGTAGGIWRRAGFSLGTALTRESGDLELDHGGSTATLRSIVPEISAQYETGRFFLSASAAWSSDDYDLRRRIVYSGRDQTASAQVSGSRLDFAITAGRIYTAGDWTLTPEAGLMNSNFRVRDFAESGAAGANLALSGWSNHSLRSHAGLVAARTTGKVTTELAVRWLHEFSRDRSFTARMDGAVGVPDPIIGRRAEIDLAEASLSASVRLGRNAIGYLTVASSWGRNSQIKSDLSAGLSWRF